MAVSVDLPADSVPLLERLVADLEATSGVDLALIEDPSNADFALFTVRCDDSSVESVARPSSGTDEERLADIADQLQDIVITSRGTNGGRTAAWPECPVHHTHPLTARSVDGTACWVCPADESTAITIGHLSSAG